MKANPYSWLLSLLVLFDTVLTLISVRYWGAAEVNPLMGLLLARSVWLFIAVKLVPIGLLVYLTNIAGKQHYLKIAFWAYLVIYLIGLLMVNHQALRAETPHKAKPAVVVKKPVTQPHWNTAVVTTYSKKFEGRRMANGRTFRHRDRVLACRCGSFGRRIELRYGRNGRSICVLSDRGGLPLHRRGRWQFDISRAAAKDLGLYRIVNGKTDRRVHWRYVD